MVICGTRAGISRYRERAARLPAHYLIAPLDTDPGSMRWPVEGAPGVTLVVAGAPGEFVLRLTQALLNDGAQMVMQLREQRPFVSFHTRNPT
jgi:hypothetical protein